jgi:hypothetical protein
MGEHLVAKGREPESAEIIDASRDILLAQIKQMVFEATPPVGRGPYGD